MEIDRIGRLAEIERFLGPLCEQALAYFARANDIFFYPKEDASMPWANLDLSNPENWGHVRFQFRVFAYSNIGNGARFEVDFGAKTFEHIPDDDSEEAHIGEEHENEGCEKEDGNNAENRASGNEDGDSSGDHDNDEEEGSCSDRRSSSSEEEEDDGSQLEQLWHLVDSDSESENESESESYVSDQESADAHSIPNDREFKIPHQTHYNSGKMFTNVKVSFHQPFGEILGKKEKSKKICCQSEDGSNANGAGEQRSVLARGISIALDSIATKQTDLRDGKEDMPEYDIARNWDVPEEDLCRQKGWARRPNRDDGMYGPSYITDTIKEIIQELFEKGATNSSEKMGPAQMREVIEDRIPGDYCIPGETALAKAISSMFQKQKKGSSDNSKKKKKKISPDIEEKIRYYMALHPFSTGKPIEELVRGSYGSESLPVYYNKKEVMARTNALRQARKQKEVAEKKRLLIG